MPKEDADDILTHCFIAMGTGIGKKGIDFDAVTSLRGFFKPLFAKNVSQYHLKWGNGNTAVLRVAKTLGLLAAKKAGSAPRISKAHADAAAREVQASCSAGPEGTREARGVFCAP